MEEILKQILDGQERLFEGQKQLLIRVDRIEQDLSDVKQDLSDVKQDLLDVKQDLSGVKQDLSGVKQDVSCIKGQQQEDTQLISALMHRTEELDAKFESLLHNTLTKDAISTLATKDDIAALDAKFEVLNSRLFHQEAELFRLKAVK